MGDKASLATTRHRGNAGSAIVLALPSADYRCVYFSTGKKKSEKQKREKNATLIMDMGFLSRGRKRLRNGILLVGLARKFTVFGTMRQFPEMAK